MQKEITKLIENFEAPAFAVFDFDNTCIVNDITEATLAFMARNDLFKDKNLLGENFEGKEYSKSVFENYHKLLNENRVKDAYEFISKILSNYSVDEVGSLADEVMDFEGQKISEDELFGVKIKKGIKPRKEIIEVINLLEDNGVEVWIVSASIEFLIAEVMKRFGVKAKLIGVKNIVVDNKITNQIESPSPMFEGKVDCIKKFISADKKPLLGAGDSIYDLPMLEYCKNKLVVDRKNALSAKAKENNWILIG